MFGVVELWLVFGVGVEVVLERGLGVYGGAWLV